MDDEARHAGLADRIVRIDTLSTYSPFLSCFVGANISERPGLTGSDFSNAFGHRIG